MGRLKQSAVSESHEDEEEEFERLRAGTEAVREVDCEVQFRTLQAWAHELTRRGVIVPLEVLLAKDPAVKEEEALEEFVQEFDQRQAPARETEPRVMVEGVDLEFYLDVDGELSDALAAAYDEDAPPYMVYEGMSRGNETFVWEKTPQEYEPMVALQRRFAASRKIAEGHEELAEADEALRAHGSFENILRAREEIEKTYPRSAEQA